MQEQWDVSEDGMGLKHNPDKSEAAEAGQWLELK